jgi:hypothetical protein
MEEGRELAAVLDGRLDERLVERVLDAAEGVPVEHRVRAGVEAVVELAEVDPGGTMEALWALQGNPLAMQSLERGLSLESGRATLALGAAIQLARAELAAADPDLRSRLPELLRWLEGAW